jgi:hypothetical protein
MASKSTAADNSVGFCIAVQKCGYGRCNKNGTHHLSISTTYSSESGEDCSDITDAWYCDKHYKTLINTK